METNKPGKAATGGPNTFGVKAIAIIGTTALVAGLLSFLVIPVMQGRDEGLDTFAALCRAIGLQDEASSTSASTAPRTRVAFDEPTFRLLASGDAGKGKEFAAEVCTACHLPTGFTSDPGTVPTITGQSARAIYKQLRDIKAGFRQSEIMKPIADGLDDQQMSDLAAYYSGLRPRNHGNPEDPVISRGTVDLVVSGDPARTLPACAACHETRAGGPLETPNLTGQYPAYVKAQLKAFAEGTRRNDVYRRMQDIAARLTPQEMAELSAYYNAPAYPLH